MKKNSEYKREERKRKKSEGKKRIEFWIYPADEIKIRQYVYQITGETKISKNSA